MSGRTFDQLLDAWLELGPTTAPERVAAAARLEARGVRQTPAALARCLPEKGMDRHRMVAFGVVAAVVVLSIVGLAYLAGRNVAAPQPTAGPSSSASPSVGAGPSLPALGLPGMSPNEPAGEYGWQTGEGVNGMHWVVPDGDSYREVAMLFASGPDCLGAEGQATTSVRVAGLDGILVEPYDPVVTFGRPDGDEITRAYALDVEGHTLCVYVTWHPSSTAAELQSTFAILETIRAQPLGDEAVRIVFTLPAGWDTG